MTRMISKLSLGLAALVVSAGLACAQTTATQPAGTPTAPPAATAPVKATKAKGVQKKASTPEGIACSAEADKQNLHGKARKSFRNKCIREMKAKAAGTAPATPAAAPATPPAAKK